MLHTHLRALLAAFSLAVAASVFAQSANFDRQSAGQAPLGWVCGATGKGSPRWVVEADAQAPSRPNVLVQRGKADFAWCALEGAPFTDGQVAVGFKLIAGKEDQAGGVVWRWQGANGYYVARANALENNVGLYYVSHGVRHTLRSRPVPVAANAWQRLEVRFHGEHVQVFFNDQLSFEFDDAHIRDPGLAGVWTKADSVTAFDDFTEQEN